MPQLRVRGLNANPKDNNSNQNEDDKIINRKEKHLPNNNDNKNTTEMVETTVIYPTTFKPEAELLTKHETLSQAKATIYRAVVVPSSSSTTKKLKRSSSTILSSSSSSEECPPLFFPHSKISSQSLSSLPSFPQRLKCNTMVSVSNHPSLYFTAFITTLFIFYCSCCRRNNGNGRRGRGRNSTSNARVKGMFWTFRNGEELDTKNKGEYTALETVYDELLDDFDDEDLSSYMQEEDDDDDDSIGTIISQYSDKDGLGNGVSKGKGGKIELTSFDDGHLSLHEING